MERFKRAKAGGFHLEAIFILYALIEDRLSSFLFHAGIFNASRDKITKNDKVRPHLNSTLTVLNVKQPSIRNVSAKIKLIKELLAWSAEYPTNEPVLNYLDALSKQINRTKGKDEMTVTLTRIEAWCACRNELVHALLNKKVRTRTRFCRHWFWKGRIAIVYSKTSSNPSKCETRCARPSTFISAKLGR